MYSEHSIMAPMPPTHTGYWLKLGDAAHALGVSEITLRRKVKCGKIPHDFRSGKYFVFLYKDETTGRFLEPAQLEEEAAGPITIVGASGSRAGIKHVGSPVAYSTASLSTLALGSAAAMPSVSFRDARSGHTPPTEPSAREGNTHGTGAIDVALERERRAWKERIEALEAGAARDAATLSALRRQVEDQQTLIAFLEETIQRVASLPARTQPVSSQARPPARAMPANGPSQAVPTTSLGNTRKRP